VAVVMVCDIQVRRPTNGYYVREGGGKCRVSWNIRLVRLVTEWYQAKNKPER